MKRRLLIVAVSIVVVLAAYVAAYLSVRRKDESQQPFYVTIRYGTDRLAVRCVNASFADDAPGMVTAMLSNDLWYNPYEHYTVATDGIFVTLESRDKIAFLKVFRPLEWCELRATHVGPRRSEPTP